MVDAYRDDKEAVKNSEIALNKLKMLNDVIAMFHRRNPSIDQQLDKDDLDRPVVNENFLKACKKWLELLAPSNSLPNLRIREALIKNLLKVEVDQAVLTNSRIGHSIMALYRHKEETMENKAVLGQIISKWIRPIFDCQVSYADLKSDAPQAAAKVQSKQKVMMPSAIDDAIDKKVEDAKRSYIASVPKMYPKKASIEYNRRPKEFVKDDDEEDKPMKKRVAENSIERVIQDQISRTSIRKQAATSGGKNFRITGGKRFA
jgi:hypothetical protein